MFKLTIVGAGISFSTDLSKTAALGYIRNIIEQQTEQTAKPETTTEKKEEPP